MEKKKSQLLEAHIPSSLQSQWKDHASSSTELLKTQDDSPWLWLMYLIHVTRPPLDQSLWLRGWMLWLDCSGSHAFPGASSQVWQHLHWQRVREGAVPQGKSKCCYQKSGNRSSLGRASISIHQHTSCPQEDATLHSWHPLHLNCILLTARLGSWEPWPWITLEPKYTDYSPQLQHFYLQEDNRTLISMGYCGNEKSSSIESSEQCLRQKKCFFGVFAVIPGLCGRRGTLWINMKCFVSFRSCAVNAWSSHPPFSLQHPFSAFLWAPRTCPKSVSPGSLDLLAQRKAVMGCGDEGRGRHQDAFPLCTSPCF